MSIRSERLASSVLATDLDGTLIPLAGVEEHVRDLKILNRLLEEARIPLCYVSGRHFESVQSAIHSADLLPPEWIICDVGTTIRKNDGGEFAVVQEFHDVLARIVGSVTFAEIEDRLPQISTLRKQEAEKQGEFKLSYYVDREHLEEAVTAIQSSIVGMPFSLIESVDPFNGDGLLDVLPSHASKAFALDWLGGFLELSREEIVFAGDSGNDLAAFLAGFRSIIVGNAPASLVEQVQSYHSQEGWVGRCYHAKSHATSGVLEGCLHYGIVDAPAR